MLSLSSQACCTQERPVVTRSYKVINVFWVHKNSPTISFRHLGVLINTLSVSIIQTTYDILGCRSYGQPNNMPCYWNSTIIHAELFIASRVGWWKSGLAVILDVEWASSYTSANSVLNNWEYPAAISSSMHQASVG